MAIEMSGIRESLPVDLKERLDRLNKKAGPALARTTSILKEFTEHTLEHSLGVEDMYDVILDDNFTLLTDTEKFLLIAATIFHDIGMVGSRKMEGKEDQLRDAHHILSRHLIVENRELLDLSEIEAEIIGSIAEAHRKVSLDQLEESLAYGRGNNVRERLLGALLRIADELHVTDDRAPELVMKLIQPNPISRMHHRRHQVISGVSRAPRKSDTVRISAVVNDSDMENALNEMIEGIQLKVDSIQEIFTEVGIKFSVVEPQYRLSGLVTKEVLLVLATNAEKCLISDVLTLLEKRTSVDVNYAINQLLALEIVHLERDHVSLVKKIDVLTHVFNELHKSQRELEFVRSLYVKETMEDLFDEFSLDRYGVRYNKGEKEDRLLLLSNSPTALDSILNAKDAYHKFGSMNRSTVLDLAILSGFSQDVTISPEIASYSDESHMAVQAILETLRENGASFIQLLKFVDEAAEQKKN